MIGHRPMWPAFRRREPRVRTLAYDNGAELVTEDGETFQPESYAEWKQTVFDQNLDVFVETVTGFRFLAAAIRDDHAEVAAVKNSLDVSARMVSISFRDGHRRFGLRSWTDWAREPGEALRIVRGVCETLGVGTISSPGAIGQETMRAHTRGRWTTPSQACLDDLRETIVGGRVDCLAEGAVGDAYEVDRNSAYGFEAGQPLPVGTACRIYQEAIEELDNYATYYLKCVVFIKKPLALGPFPFREPSGEVTYPTLPGQYRDVWLWREEIEAATAAGCHVLSEGEGWGWRERKPVFAEWSRWIYERRREETDPAIASGIKRCIVAAIGYFAMSDVRHRIVSDDDPEGNAVLLDEGGRIMTGMVASQGDTGSPIMVHWASYIWSQARLTLYHRMQAEMEAGNRLIGSNFDSYMVIYPSRLPLAPGELGMWREMAISDVHIPYSRALVAEEKIRLPGLTGPNREEVIEAIKSRHRSDDRERGYDPEWEDRFARRVEKLRALTVAT